MIHLYNNNIFSKNKSLFTTNLMRFEVKDGGDGSPWMMRGEGMSYQGLQTGSAMWELFMDMSTTLRSPCPSMEASEEAGVRGMW